MISRQDWNPRRGFTSILCLAILLMVQRAELGFTEEPSASQSVQEAMTRVAESKGPNAFFGHYNYMVTLPQGYGATADFADPERLVEIVLVGPAPIIATAMNGELVGLQEQEYGSLGIIQVEVVPKNHPQFGGRSVPFQAFRDTVPATLQEHGETFTVKELSLSYPAFAVLITAPQELVQVFVEGREVVYTFTAGKDDDKLHELLASLKEL